MNKRNSEDELYDIQPEINTAGDDNEDGNDELYQVQPMTPHNENEQILSLPPVPNKVQAMEIQDGDDGDGDGDETNTNNNNTTHNATYSSMNISSKTSGFKNKKKSFNNILLYITFFLALYASIISSLLLFGSVITTNTSSNDALGVVTLQPTLSPTDNDVNGDTLPPSPVPTLSPSPSPTDSPTVNGETLIPTKSPSPAPTIPPTASPSLSPSMAPSPSPTTAPTDVITTLDIIASGSILIWSDCASVPNGYDLCDGSNGTPDLRGKFIVGADGSTFIEDGTGGTMSHSHTGSIPDGFNTDNHTLLENEMPSHVHSGVYQINNCISASGGGSNCFISPTNTNSNPTGGDQPHFHGLNTVSVDVAAESHLPPYYVLCYIMKNSDAQSWFA